MIKDWFNFDEPVQRVVLAALDVVVTDLLADVAYQNAHATGGALTFKMVMEAELAEVRKRHGEDAVRDALAHAQPMLDVMSVAVGTADAVHDMIASAHEAANAMLDGKSSAEWLALSGNQRDVIVSGLTAKRHERTQLRSREHLSAAVKKAAGAAGMAAIFSSLGAGSNAMSGAAQGFEAGFETGDVVDQAILDAFDSAAALMSGVERTEEKAA